MRIAVWHDPPPGGARRALNELVDRLARRHTVETYQISFRARPHRRLGAYWNDWSTVRDLCDQERQERELAERIDAGGHDVALVSVLRSGQASSVLAYPRTPTAYYCHEPPRRFWEPWCRPEAAPLARWERLRLLWRWPTRALIEREIRRRDLRNVRRARIVLANSRYTRDRIQLVYGRDAEVCYPGVDGGRFPSPKEFPASTNVISVGALEAHKGFDFVIGALGRIPEARRPSLTLVGAGGHPRMPSYLTGLAEQAGVRLQIQRGLSDDELRDRYGQAAAFVFGAHQEPFGLVLLEAMASGLPIVAVGEGGVPEIVEDGRTGYLVPRDESQFAAALDRLLTDSDLRRKLALAARERVDARWSWDDAAARVEQCLEALARPPASWPGGRRA
ncbi:MAG: glycosyltransferase family 4 protein [Chloroflexota bacterium]